MTVKELETRCEAVEQEIVSVKLEIALLHQRFDEQQKQIESLHVTLKTFMAQTIGGSPSQSNSLLTGETLIRKGKEVAEDVPANNNEAQGNDRNRFKKVEMPIFGGEELEAWIFRAERYFEIQKLTDEEKMIVAIISFDGIALAWYRYTDNREKHQDWNDLKGRLREVSIRRKREDNARSSYR
ncbi:uncharacterized protein LOC111008840 [Momordica charantia]|uniref:Uncharacterized protein LOC111008840 n=1 Tax=Momordica charantia TaxID=3673 RepID=A0A6J1C719_MOMCH|nr:uncharacterized protein LOC111008840 [Momordica charantia]